MKLTLEYNLPDEIEDYHMILNARKYYEKLCDIQQYIKKKCKYSEITENEQKMLEDILEMTLGIDD